MEKIDQAARNRMANALSAYLECKIDNIALDDALCPSNTSDTLCNAVSGQMWYFYSDVGRHYNSDKYQISDEDVVIVRRWIHLLHSSLQIEPPEQRPFGLRGLIDMVRRCAGRSTPQFRVNQYWPLASHQEWKIQERGNKGDRGQGGMGEKGTGPFIGPV